MLVSRRAVLLFQKRREDKTRFCFKKKKKHNSFLVLLFKQRRADQVLFQEKEETQSVCFRKPGFVSRKRRNTKRLFQKIRFCFTKNQVLFKKKKKNQVFVSFKGTGVVQEGRTRRKEEKNRCCSRRKNQKKRNGAVLLLLVSRTASWRTARRTACFKNRSKTMVRCCLFQEPLKEMVLFFFCLFQESLVSRTQRAAALLLLLCFEEFKEKKRRTWNQEPGTRNHVVSC